MSIDPHCLRGWNIVSKISESNNRQNYIVKSESYPEKNYLLKIGDLTFPTTYSNNSFQDEIKITLEMSSLGIAPKILDTWICTNKYKRELNKRNF